MATTITPPYGTDISAAWINPATGRQDLDPYFTLQTGPNVLTEAVERRLLTPSGQLFYDQDYGFDLSAELNAGLDSAAVSRLQMSIENEVTKDERVLSATSNVTQNTTLEDLVGSVQIVVAPGPYANVLPVGQVTAATLMFTNSS